MKVGKETIANVTMVLFFCYYPFHIIHKIISDLKTTMHQWSSGRIVPCHGTDPGSIPGWYSVIFLFFVFGSFSPHSILLVGKMHK
jgi:hypothetical protein